MTRKRLEEYDPEDLGTVGKEIVAAVALAFLLIIAIIAVFGS